MSEASQFAFVTFTSILFLVDPIAVVPAYLAFVRSGAMSTVMVLGAQAETPASKAIVHASIVLTMLISWAMLRGADKVFARLGESGIRVATRIMGLLLAAVAVQFVISGAQDAGIIQRAVPVIQQATTP